MTILHALLLAMAAGALFGGAYEVSRGPVSEGQRAFPGALRQPSGRRGAGSAAAAPAPRIGVGSADGARAGSRSPLISGEGRGHGFDLLLRRPSPVLPHEAAMCALERTVARVHQSVSGPIVPRAR